MSRSNNTDLENPAVRFFKWNGEDGAVVYWDKEADNGEGGKGVNVEVPFPFRFLVLDNLTRVGGGIREGDDYVGYFSNAIRAKQLKTGVFRVKSKRGEKIRTEAEGTYKQVKEELTGAKFITSLYIGFLDPEDKKFKIANLELKGSALNAWIEATKNGGIYNGGFAITEGIKKTSGSKKNPIVYYEPKFSRIGVPEELDQQAVQLDEELQKYLTAYFNRGDDEYAVEETDDAPLFTGEPKAKAQSAGSEELPSWVTEDDDEGGDDDVPWPTE